MDSALKDEYIKKKNPVLKETDALIRISGGDARKLLNAFELVVQNLDENNKEINDDIVKKSIQQNLTQYDKKGEMHYDIISTFIKSIREVIQMQAFTGSREWLKATKIRNL